AFASGNLGAADRRQAFAATNRSLSIARDEPAPAPSACDGRKALREKERAAEATQAKRLAVSSWPCTYGTAQSTCRTAHPKDRRIHRPGNPGTNPDDHALR